MGIKSIYTVPLIALLLPVSMVFAAEIMPIKLTRVDGNVSLNYREDGQTIQLAGESASVEQRTSFEQSLYIETEGYVYHPKLLNFEVGLGPTMIQSDLNSNAGTYVQNETLYNINATLDFLEDKPYPFTLSYYKENPTLSLSLTDQFEQENIRYGVNFQLKRPLLPINLVLDHTRQEMRGEGFEKRVDELVDQTIMRTYFPSGADGYQQLVASSTEVTSNTGLISDPISPDNYTTNNISYDSNIFFGKKRNIRFTNLMAYTDQTGVRDYQELRITPTLRWSHSKQTESFYRFSYVDNDQITIQSTNQSAATGLRHETKDGLLLDAEVNSNNDVITGLTNTSQGAKGSANYIFKLANGELSLSSGIQFDQVDRNITSNVPVSMVITLVGTTPYELPHDYIIHSTITARLVETNDPLVVDIGNLCTASTDLLVTPIGSRTRVVYCKGFDEVPEDIEINYEYDPGGSVVYDNLITYMQANLNLYKKYSVFAHLRRSSPSILSGDPVLPLDDSTSIIYGTVNTFPLGNERDIGLEYTAEEVQSSLTPYTRNVLDCYYQNPLWLGTLRLGAQKINTDYLTSTEDIDSIRYTVQYRARPNHTMTINIGYSDNTDLGSTLDRNTQSANLSFSMHIRKLSFNAEYRYINETQGQNLHKRSLLRAILKRDF